MGAKVTIYTTKSCASCQMAKRYMGYKGVVYEEVNLDEYPERQAEALQISGAMTVPVIVVDRAEKRSVVVGYNLSKLAPALA